MEFEAVVELTEATVRRRRSVQERRLIVEETMLPGASVARVARKHGVNANQVFGWRKLYEMGRLGAASSGMTLLPVRVAEERAPAEEMPAAPVPVPSGTAASDSRTGDACISVSFSVHAAFRCSVALFSWHTAGMITASLPDLELLDLEAAKALLIAQHETFTATLSSRAGEIERLTLLVEKLQCMLFGTKSEKVLRQIEQLELQMEDLHASKAAEERREVPFAAKPAPAKPFRRPLPEHLPREIHTHMPDHDACPDCGRELRQLGEDTAEILEYVRASFKVIRHVRPQAELRGLRPDRAGAGTVTPHRSRARRIRSAGACAGLEVRRSSTAVPAVGDLCSRRRRSGSLYAGCVGRSYE